MAPAMMGAGDVGASAAGGLGAGGTAPLAGANALASGSPEYTAGLSQGGAGGFSGMTDTGAGFSGATNPSMGMGVTPEGTQVGLVNPSAASPGAASPGSSWGDMAAQAWSKLKSGMNQLMQLRDPNWAQESPMAKIGSIIQGLDPQSHPAKSTPWMQFGLPGGAGVQLNPPNRPQLDPQAQQLAIMQAFNMQ
jgi:X-X-X-Leu-X-X-Gly heptad repeat protein